MITIDGLLIILRKYKGVNEIMIYVIIATVIAVIIGGLATANNSGGPMVGALC